MTLVTTSHPADEADGVDDRPGVGSERGGPGFSWGAAVACAAAVTLVSVVGSLVTQPAVDSSWFDQLDKPSWYPPNALFGQVWTVLYVLIAIAGYRAWRHGAPTSTLALYGVQLALNLAWSVIFFGLRSPGWALVEVVVLFAAIAVVLVRFWAVDRIAGALFVPYLAWVLFATALTSAIVALN
jgi:tryptophan-rich sensory protein